MMLTESERLLLKDALSDWRWRCAARGYYRLHSDEYYAVYNRHWTILWGTLPGNGGLW